uniref:ANF_receptor domain-containing protein n=1 Tax=Globodera pallida TaxID=36090 RepID=A0A183CB16_GLOPA
MFGVIIVVLVAIIDVPNIASGNASHALRHPELQLQQQQQQQQQHAQSSTFADYRRWRRHLPTPTNDVFPLLGAIFLPDDAEIERSSTKNEISERHLATIASVMPIIDVAIRDAHRRYLAQWTDAPEWLQIHTAPILHCHDQGRAAWAALEAVQWTNGTGLDVAFGPACDYVLATVTRILSFYRVPIFTNAGFSEFFIEQKSTVLLTRVGPLQDHISELLERLFRQFGWMRSRMFYEKQFWETELHEAGFCKLLMNGLYARTVTKRWGLEMSASIVPSSRGTHWARQDLVELVGVNNGARNFARVERCAESRFDAGVRGGTETFSGKFPAR